MIDPQKYLNIIKASSSLQRKQKIKVSFFTWYRKKITNKGIYPKNNQPQIVFLLKPSLKSAKKNPRSHSRSPKKSDKWILRTFDSNNRKTWNICHSENKHPHFWKYRTKNSNLFWNKSMLYFIIIFNTIKLVLKLA